MRAYRINGDSSYSRKYSYTPTVKINQSITMTRKGKDVPAKVKTIGDHMIDVTANGKTFTCTYDCGKWVCQGK